MRNSDSSDGAGTGSAPKERVYGLDVLRAVAILAVVISHCRFFLVPEFGIEFARLRLFGYIGVELFFVLSGFLIGEILFKHREKHGHNRALLDFWIRRWWRTLPNYYLFLAFNLVVAYVLGPGLTGSQILYFFFMQNLAWPTPEFFGESWSLAVEEWFYLIFPLLFWILAKRMDPITALFYAALVIAGTAFIGRIIAVEYYDLQFNTMRKIVVLRLDALMFGVAGVYLKRCHPQFWACKLRCLAIGTFLLLVSILLYGVFERPWLDQSIFGRTVYFSMVSFSVLLLLPWLESWRRSPNWITRISIWSYSMYLVNFPLMRLMIGSKILEDYSLGWLLGPLIYAALTILISGLVYTFFERRMTELRERFSTTK